VQAATSSLDPSRLRTHRVLHSASHSESQAGLAAELVDHRLAWGRGRVDTRFSRVRLQHLSMGILHYGAEVEVRPEPLREFLLVQMPLRGRADILGASASVRVSPSLAAIVSPNRPVRLHWEAGCEQLLIKLPLAGLREVARRLLNLPEQALARERFEFAPQLDLGSDAGRVWMGLVDALLRSVPVAGGSAFDARWCRQLEESAMLFLLLHQPNCLQKAEPRGAMPPAAADPLARMQAYIAQRLGAPVSLLDLARAAGVSVRSLHTLCSERLQASPMAVLRQARLDAARRCLLQGGRTVTEVAYAHGFEHLGRFSAYYRQRFGELPSATAC
jgi:AraC-like DNA-binding protein